MTEYGLTQVSARSKGLLPVSKEKYKSIRLSLNGRVIKMEKMIIYIRVHLERTMNGTS